MPIEIIRCLQDNYAYLLHDEATGETTLIDAPEAPPILAALRARGWALTRVLITHHHWDHVEGLAAILAEAPAPVFGARADAHRLPPLDHAFEPGDRLPGGVEVGAAREPDAARYRAADAVNVRAYWFRHQMLGVEIEIVRAGKQSISVRFQPAWDEINGN